MSHHAQQQLRDRLDRIELPADAQSHRVLLGLDAAGADDRVLNLQRLADGARVDREAGQLLGRKFDKDLVLLHADELDLGHVRQAQQLLAHPLDVVAQLRVREPVGRERIDGPEHVAELIVEERAQRLSGEGLADVTDLLPDLVPDVRHVLRRGRVEQLEDDQRLAGLGVAARPLEVGRLLQLLLDPVGDLLVHLLGGGAGPQRADYHAAKGKVRVLALTELEKCNDPADRDHDDEKERQFPVLECRARQVEAIVRHGALLRVGYTYTLPRAQQLRSGNNDEVAREQPGIHQHMVARKAPRLDGLQSHGADSVLGGLDQPHPHGLAFAIQRGHR